MANIMRLGGGVGGGGYGTLPEQVSKFAAAAGDKQVVLSWVNPTTDWSGTKIVRKTGSYPQSASDGVTVYDGTAATYTDTGLTNGTVYWYRPFAYNAAKEVQTINLSATATPVKAPTLGMLKVGDKLKFGSIFGQKIIQKVANKTDSLVTLITDGLVFRGAFDAAEPNNSNSIIQKEGNGRYSLSNIHQWLNSSAGAGQWYKAQHSADEPPLDQYCYDGKCGYNTSPGYLNEWTADEISKLQTVSIACGMSYTAKKGGGIETISAKVYLPSEREMGLNSEYSGSTQLELFSDNNSRIAKFSTSLAERYYGGSVSTGWYWLRDPYVQYGGGDTIHTINGVGADGGPSGTQAYHSYFYCARPLCNLLPSTLVSLQPDSDGCYAVI